MKLLDGKTPLIGQPVVTLAADGYAVAGQIQMLNERNGTVRITGYALAVPADKVVLAADAYAAYAAQLKAAAPAPDVAPPAPELPPKTSQSPC